MKVNVMRKNCIHTITFTTLFTLHIFNVSAQSGSLKGTVKHGGNLLEAATVTLGAKTILSNYIGEFSLSVSPGNYKLNITHAGYQTIIQEVKIQEGQTHVADFIMTPVEELGEVIVVGSRSLIQRSSMNTPVPVDVITSRQLIQTGQISLTQMLNLVAPSFNASRESLNEPATLRGLDPNHILILVNGIRYHNMAQLYSGSPKGQLGRGSVSNDLNSIPFSAIEKIEILRDGASAQYGSDAIAGIINIRLKETAGKTSIRLHTGQYYGGDGEKFSVGINHGISLPARMSRSDGNKKGFLNFSADFRHQLPTYRAGIYEGTVFYDLSRYPISKRDSILALDNQKINESGFNRSAGADNVGNFKGTSAGVLVNGGYTLSSQTKFFWTATINDRRVLQNGPYRFPKNTNQVNLALYPNGFQAKLNANTVDVSVFGGIKGETKNNWRWDLSNSYGTNTLKNHIRNTNNASQSIMGVNAPTSFYTGSRAYKQLINDINFARSFFNLPGHMRSLNLGFGAEWRLENYQSIEGEEASWKNYDTTGRLQGGVGNGISPDNALNQNRNVIGSYIDMEAEITDRFLLNVAGRYEHHSDFGSNTAGKLAARYKFSDKFSFRTSVSNGFRAPSLQQRYFSNTSPTLAPNAAGVRVPVTRGIFPNNHHVAKALGIPLLTAEKTINISSGVTAKVLDQVSLTVDAYWIQIKNRIVLSGRFDRNNLSNGVDQILSSYPDLREIDQIAFYSNAINTRTRGIDFVLTSHWSINRDVLRIMLAANVTHTRIYGIIQSAANLPADSSNTNTLFGRAERGAMEKGQPSQKIILHTTYTKSKMAFNVNNTLFVKKFEVVIK
jgi:iron complex outermembrane receptor protein